MMDVLHTHNHVLAMEKRCPEICATLVHDALFLIL